VQITQMIRLFALIHSISASLPQYQHKTPER